MTDDEVGALEAKIYQVQEELIKAQYGEDIAQLANYGWAVEVTDELVGVATKVYSDPMMILGSEAKPNGEINHQWLPYK
jgi:hypothetical protein